MNKAFGLALFFSVSCATSGYAFTESERMAWWAEFNSDKAYFAETARASILSKLGHGLHEFLTDKNKRDELQEILSSSYKTFHNMFFDEEKNDYNLEKLTAYSQWLVWQPTR
ncbi:hypothetical protein K2X40_01440 [Candidatus Babeliales bacterium]|nr:hypothetical protein [Candidatus Babeliales bacterium]